MWKRSVTQTRVPLSQGGDKKQRFRLSRLWAKQGETKLKGGSWSKNRGKFVIVKNRSHESPGLGHSSTVCWGKEYSAEVLLAQLHHRH